VRRLGVFSAGWYGARVWGVLRGVVGVGAGGDWGGGWGWVSRRTVVSSTLPCCGVNGDTQGFVDAWCWVLRQSSSSSRASSRFQPAADALKKLVHIKAHEKHRT